MAGMYPQDENIEILGAVEKWPGMGADGKFTNGDFNDPESKGSFVPAQTMNLILDNLAAFIESFGETPNNASPNQLANLGIARGAYLHWSAKYRYAEDEFCCYNHAWYYPNALDMPQKGESPESHGAKWIKFAGGGDGSGGGGGSNSDLEQVVQRNYQKIMLLWAEVFGESLMINQIVISFDSLDGITLERGIWNEAGGRLEC